MYIYLCIYILQLFHPSLIQIEQAEYEAENIDWSYVTFYDNQQCVDLVDGKPNGKSGVFQTLDDASASGRLDVNSSFLAQLNQTWSGSAGSLTTKHPNYVFPRFNSDSIFGVIHYAGEVQYNIASFAEKNKDSTNNDMRDLLAKSSNELLRKIMENAPMDGPSSSRGAGTDLNGPFSQVATQTSKKSKKASATSAPARSGHVNKLKEDSISKQFSASLRQLGETLDGTDPHFVRCMKPNSSKVPNSLNVLELQAQLRNAGMMETIRIRQQGYGSRQLHKSFFKRYLPLEPSCRTLQQLVDFLSHTLNVNAESWQVGTTKLFIKNTMNDKLEHLLLIRYSSMARRIQRAWKCLLRRVAILKIQRTVRRFTALTKYRIVLIRILTIQTLIRGRNCALLYRKQLRSVLCIQCLLRGKAARLRARRMINPLNRMGYEALTAILLETDEELEVTIAAKDFARCDILQDKLKDIHAARAKLPLPEVTPTSRKELDIMILEAKYNLDHATTVHDMELCSKLEIRLTQLEGHKIQYCTVEERKSLLSDAIATLDDAMIKKDFKRCTQLQQDVATCESKLGDAIKAGAHAIRETLESIKQRKSAVEIVIATALASKDFDQCSDLQPLLDSLVNEIAHRDCHGSLETASDRLKKVQMDIDAAKTRKNFLKMAELNQDYLEFKGLVDEGQVAAAAQVNR
jgi:myosin heavy subunit